MSNDDTEVITDETGLPDEARISADTDPAEWPLAPMEDALPPADVTREESPAPPVVPVEAPRAAPAADPDEESDDAAPAPKKLAPIPAKDLAAQGPHSQLIALSYIEGAGFVDLPARSLTVQEVWSLVRSCEKLEQVLTPLGPYRRTRYTPPLPAAPKRES